MSETDAIAPSDANKSLIDFLLSQLMGSSLQIKYVSETQLVIEAEQLLAITISLDEPKKQAYYELYSPEWKRSITIEELDGFDFLESRAEEELKKLDLEANAEDVLLSIDLLRYWARLNDYTIEERKVPEAATSSRI